MDFYSERRQHISLSSYAFNTIKSDCYAFSGSRSNISGFINRIFLERFENTEPLEKKNRTDYSFKIRPSNEVSEVLQELEGNVIGPNCEFSTRASLFNAILENYALLPQYEREAIVYSNILNSLENSLLLPPQDRRILKIKYVTARGETIICQVKPYRMVSDSARTFHYLVGYSKKISPITDLDYAPFPFRISRIVDLRTYSKSHGSANLSEVEKQELQQSLDSKGVQFMLGNISEFKVLLTPDGFNMYRSTTHLRPLAEEKLTTIDSVGNVNMTFYSTELQILQYFFRFGMHAVILSPVDTRNKIAESYRKALEFYETPY